jgi:hypothetical protein
LPRKMMTDWMRATRLAGWLPAHFDLTRSVRLH